MISHSDGPGTALKNARKGLGMSRVEFGKALWELAPGKRDFGHTAYSPQYVCMLEHGHANVPPAIATVVQLILSQTANGETIARQVTAIAMHPLPPGTVILAEARACANPGCPVRFVPTCPQQKYHSPLCARAVRRLRRRASRERSHP